MNKYINYSYIYLYIHIINIIVKQNNAQVSKIKKRGSEKVRF